MDQVEFVGSVTELSYGRDDDDDYCPSAEGRVVSCCSAGIE
jgi:hypothetical protein